MSYRNEQIIRKEHKKIEQEINKNILDLYKLNKSIVSEETFKYKKDKLLITQIHSHLKEAHVKLRQLNDRIENWDAHLTELGNMYWT